MVNIHADVASRASRARRPIDRLVTEA